MAKLTDPAGKGVGVVALSQTPDGTLLHASSPACRRARTPSTSTPSASANRPSNPRGHFNPGGKKHGILAGAGLPVGDMPNIHVPASGSLEIQVLNTRLKLDSSLFDADGAAIVLHAGADDYKSDPAGAAGGRIACGVIAK